MGGSGALRFCGDLGLQLVITRRHPGLSGCERDKDPTVDKWAVTVVRREEPSDLSGEPVHSEFTYLSPIGAEDSPRKGGVLSFRSDSMPLMPEHDEPYARDVAWGTAIKLYEYKTTVGQSNVLLPDGLLYALERLLPETALPFRLHECRGYRGDKERSFATTVSGLVVRLEDGRGGNLEHGFPKSVRLNAVGMELSGRIYAFKEDRASTYLRDEGVIFAINGQAHGYLPRTMFARPKAVGLPRLKDSLLVLIDCSKISVRQREDLFMPSRDRLSKSSIRYALEREIEQMLKEHKDLRRLQQERKDKDVQSRLSEERPLEEVLSKVLKSSPTLQALFLRGQRLSRPFSRPGKAPGERGGGGKPNKPEDFEGKRHPTYFRISAVEYGQVYKRNAELRRRCRIKFETDVENEYFDRPEDRGTFELEIVDGTESENIPGHSLALEDGEAFLNMALPEDASVGETFVLQASVYDATLIEPFVNLIEVTVQPTRQRRGGEGKLGNEGLRLPDVVPVRKDDTYWKKYKFDDQTACHVISEPIAEEGDDGVQHTFYINVDNDSLQTEMKYSKQDVRLLEAKFKYGNVLLGLALLHELDGANATNKNVPGSEASSEYEKSSEEHIRLYSRAVAPMLLPMIDQLSGLTDSELEAFSDTGEDT